MRAKREREQGQNGWYGSLVRHLRWMAPAMLLLSGMTGSSAAARMNAAGKTTHHDGVDNSPVPTDGVYNDSTSEILERIMPLEVSRASAVSPTLTPSISSEQKLDIASLVLSVTASPAPKEDQKETKLPKKKIYQPSANSKKQKIKLPPECEKHFKVVGQGGEIKEDLSNLKVVILGEEHEVKNNGKRQRECMSALLDRREEDRENNPVILMGEGFSFLQKVPCDSIVKGFNADECRGWYASDLKENIKSFEVLNTLEEQEKLLGQFKKEISGLPATKKQKLVFLTELFTKTRNGMRKEMHQYEKRHKTLFEKARKKDSSLLPENFNSSDNLRARIFKNKIEALDRIYEGINENSLFDHCLKNIQEIRKEIGSKKEVNARLRDEAVKDNEFLAQNIINRSRLDRGASIFAVAGNGHVDKTWFSNFRDDDLPVEQRDERREFNKMSGEAVNVLNKALNEEVEENPDDFNFLLFSLIR